MQLAHMQFARNEVEGRRGGGGAHGVLAA